ncbi:hypothetical protein MASR1M46_04680 [Bacteroidales bacterium]
MSSKGETQNLASLDNYRIPINKKSAYIGKIHLPKEFTKSENDIVYKIIIDTAKLFRINKKGEINLRAGRVLSEGDPFRFSVTIAAYERGNKEKTLRMEFELVKDQFLKNIVVAHRGAWKESAAPQNSIKALKNAIESGCSWSEFDLWMSSDGVPVCNHDPSIKGHMVEDTPASVLTSIELSAGEYLPTVEQYIRTAMEQNKTGLVVEIKPSGKSIERTLELTDKLEQVLKIDPLAKTAYLGSNKSVEEISQSRMRGVDFNISMFRKDPLLVKKAKERGLTVNVWTVNSEEDLRAMIDLGVDYITTNEPELLFKILAK